MKTRNRSSGWMVVSLLLVPLAWGDATGAEAPPDPDSAAVRLEFAWPVGTRARVTTTKSRRTTGDRKESSSGTTSYTMQVAALGDSLRIQSLDPRFEAEGDLAGVPAAARAQFADALPEFVVDREGAFLGLHDPAAARSAVLGMLRGAMKEPVDEGVRNSIEGMLTEEVLSNFAAQAWNAVVGAWVGGEMELGAEYETSARGPVPIAPGETILMRNVFRAERLVPCKRAGSDRRCVELTMTTTPDPEEMKTFLQAFLAKFPGGEQVPRPSAFDIVTEVRLVTEPAGMLPHSMSMIRRTSVTMEVEGRKSQAERVDETRTSYVYP
jgi:hypothetical protein